MEIEDWGRGEVEIKDWGIGRRCDRACLHELTKDIGVSK